MTAIQVGTKDDARHFFIVDGQDLSDHVTSVTIVLEPLERPRISIDLRVDRRWSDIYRGDNAEVTVYEDGAFTSTTVTTIAGEAINE